MDSRSLLAIAALALSFCPGFLSGQDVHEVILERGEFFSQCTTNRPDAKLSRSHALQAIVFAAFGGSVISGTLVTPGGIQLVLNDDGSSFHSITSLVSSASAGTYSFAVTTLDQGLLTLNVSLPGAVNAITPLRVANFLETQQVDADQDFNLSWDKPPKLNANDYLLVSIYDTNNAQVLSLSHLPVSQTNVVIAARTLLPNTTYNASVSLRHYLFLRNSKLPILAATEVRVTRFKLKTINPAGRFSFDSNPIMAGEQDGMAEVVVQRAHGSAGHVTVDFYSSDRTAVAGTNYSSASGTLDFPEGTTNQTISIALLDDGVATAALRFQLTLTNATGGADLVVRPHTTVTILDSQSPPGTNINAVMLARVRFYSQTSSNPPSQSNLCDAARFYASVHTKFSGALTQAVLRLPRQNNAVALTNSGGFAEFDVDFPSISALAKGVHTGKYQFSIDTLTEGRVVPSLTLGAERVFPAPRVANWEELQAADPAQPVTLQWDAFSGATSNDYVRVSIWDPAREYVIATPSEFEAGALPGTAPSFTIPAGTLDYGTAYLANLIFVKIREGKPLANGIRNGVASVHTTEFFIHTTPDGPGAKQQSVVGNFEVDCASCSTLLMPVPLMDWQIP